MLVVTAAAADATSMPVPDGGELEGRWEGSASCRDVDVPLILDLLQEGRDIAALATISMPNRSGSSVTYTERRELLLGTVDDRGAFELQRGTIVLERQTLRGLAGHSAGNTVLHGATDGLPSNWRCQDFTLRRTGAPQTPTGSNHANLVGTWAGFDFQVRLRDLERTDQLNNLSATRTMQTIVSFGEHEGSLYGHYAVAHPVTSHPDTQDRYEVMIRPLLVMDDGRLAFVTVGPRTAGGTFATDRNGYGEGAFIVVFALPDDGTITLERMHSRTHGLQLRAAGTDALAAFDAGEGPKVPMPETMGGTFASASTVDAQCRALQAWVSPVLDTVDFSQLSVTEGLAELLPVFDDRSFEPIFGAPFADMPESARDALWHMTRWICPNRINYDKFSGGVMDYALHNARTFEQLVTMLDDLEDSGIWYEQVTAEIEELSDVTASLVRLDEIETEAATRAGYLEDDAKTALEVAIAARRNAIAVADLITQIAGVSGWPDVEATLAQLVQLLRHAAQMKISAEIDLALVHAVRAKADMIVVPRIEAALEEAVDLPISLAGLETVTRLVREVGGLIERLEPELGSREAHARTQSLRDLRQKLVGDLHVQDEFRTALAALEIAPGGDAHGRVENEAGRYLEPEEYRGVHAEPAYEAAVADTIFELELSAIHFADRSTRHDANEPAANEMLVAMKREFDRLNSDLLQIYSKCQRSEFDGDPIMAVQCLGILAAGGGEAFQVRLTRFEKLDCRAKQDGPGYLCEYVLGFEATSPFVHNFLSSLTISGSSGYGGFVPIGNEWVFVSTN